MEKKLCLLDIVRRRAGHVLVSYKKKLYLWGGYMEPHYPPSYASLAELQIMSYFHNPKEIWIYESLLNIWHRKLCSGNIPIKLSGSNACVIGHFMYLFGGYNDSQSINGNVELIWRLDLETFVWEQLMPSGFLPYPCDKAASWVYKDRFYIFGGFGPKIPFNSRPPVPVSFETEDGFISKGWLDQLIYYDTNKNKWVWPETCGPKPGPRAAHGAATLLNKAYVFGGRFKDQRLNDFYCLDMDEHRWTIVPVKESEQIPLGRSWHTLDPISNDKLILYGGFSTNCEVYDDAWLFDPNSLTWSILSSNQLTKRLWHCGASIDSSEVYYVGGISNNLLIPTRVKEHAERMLRLRFTPPSLFQLSLEFVSEVFPKPMWSGLSPVVRRILEIRTDPFEIHGIQ